MTAQELVHQVAQGEGPHLEFKQRVPSPTRMAKEVAAFANTRGGNLLIGISDDGTVTGLKDAAEEEYALRHAVEEYSDPPVAVDTQRVRISRKRDVIVVSVSESSRKPHYVHDPDSGRRVVYLRLEDKSLEASKEARRLMRKRPDRDMLIRIGHKERVLFRHLAASGRITVRQFARLAKIKRSLASLTLVHLTRANMLRHHVDVDEDYFTPGVELRSA